MGAVSIKKAEFLTAYDRYIVKLDSLTNQMVEINAEKVDVSDWVDWDISKYGSSRLLKSKFDEIHAGHDGAKGQDEFLEFFQEYSSDVLLWADQVDRYVCIALDTYDRLVDTTIYLLKGTQYNGLFTIIDEMIEMINKSETGLFQELSDIINIESDNTENGTNVDEDGQSIRIPFNNNFDILDSTYLNATGNISDIESISTEGFLIFSKFKQCLKIISTVGITMNVSDRAWNSLQALNNSEYSSVETTKDQIDSSEFSLYSEPMSNNINYPDNNIIINDIRNLVESTNLILNYCLIEGEIKINDSLSYEIIKNENDDIKMTPFESKELEFYISETSPSDILVQEFPDEVLKVIKEHVFGNILEYNDEALKTYFLTFGDVIDDDEVNSSGCSFNDFKLTVTISIPEIEQYRKISRIEDTIKKVINIQNSIGTQYILKTLFPKRSNNYLISLNYYDDDNFVFEPGVEKSFNNNALTLTQSYFNSIYNELLFDNSNTEFVLAKTTFINYLTVKSTNEVGIATIVQKEDGQTIRQFGKVQYKYSVVRNDFQVFGGKFSININGSQTNCQIYNGTIRKSTIREFNNNETDEEVLKMESVNADYTFKLYNPFLNYNLEGVNYNNKTEGFKVEFIDIYNKQIERSYIHELTTVNEINYRSTFDNITDDDGDTNKNYSITKTIDENNKTLVYVTTNTTVKMATNVANTYRYKVKNGGMNHAEAGAKANLRSMQFLGIRRTFQEFIDRTWDRGIPKENYEANSTMDIVL